MWISNNCPGMNNCDPNWLLNLETILFFSLSSPSPIFSFFQYKTQFTGMIRLRMSPFFRLPDTGQSGVVFRVVDRNNNKQLKRKSFCLTLIWMFPIFLSWQIVVLFKIEPVLTKNFKTNPSKKEKNIWNFLFKNSWTIIV